MVRTKTIIEATMQEAAYKWVNGSILSILTSTEGIYSGNYLKQQQNSRDCDYNQTDLIYKGFCYILNKFLSKRVGDIEFCH